MTLMNIHVTSIINIDMFGTTTYVLPKFREKRRSILRPNLLDKNLKIPYTSEILLENFIDNDFLAVLKPLNLMQSLLICSKYSISDNFITSNSYLYNFIGIFGLMISRCAGLYDLITSITNWEALALIPNWTSVYDFCSYSYGFIIIYYNNIKWSNTNILLVLKIQHVIRALKITGKDLFVFTVQNWVFVITINGIIIGSIIYMTYIFYPYTNIGHMSYYYFSMTFDVNVLYAKFMIKLTCKALCVWTEDARKAGNSKSESYWECMFDVYMNILQIYRTVEKTFRHLIAFFTIFAVSHGLMNIAIIIQMRLFIEDGGFSVAIFIVITQIWFVKNIMTLTYLSIECERFYTATREVQSAMIMFSKRRGLSETQRRVCKNVQRVQNAACIKMDACGVFIIDATLPLRLFSFITTHTVVLLQFSM